MLKQLNGGKMIINLNELQNEINNFVSCTIHEAIIVIEDTGTITNYSYPTVEHRA